MGSFWIWFNTPPGKGDVLDPFGLFCLVLFVPGFVISAYLARPGADRLARDPIQLIGFRHCATMGLWVFGAGLVFFGVRAMQLNPLSFGEPKWLLAIVAVFLFSAARGVDWWRTEYPAEHARRVPMETITARAELGSGGSTAPPAQMIPQSTVRD